MKKLFETPAFEVEKFIVCDVITTSTGGSLGDNEGDLDIGG